MLQGGNFGAVVGGIMPFPKREAYQAESDNSHQCQSHPPFAPKLFCVFIGVAGEIDI